MTSSSAGLVMSPIGVGGGVIGSGGGGMVSMQSNGHHHHHVHSNHHSNGLTLSPSSLGSPEYDDLGQMWYDDAGYGSQVIALHQGQGGGGQTVPGMTNLGGGNGGGINGGVGGHNGGMAGVIVGNSAIGQTTMVPLPSMTHGSMGHTPRSTSANSISSGKTILFLLNICAGNLCYIEYRRR